MPTHTNNRRSHCLSRDDKIAIVYRYVLTNDSVRRIARDYGLAENAISGILSRRGIHSKNREEFRRRYNEEGPFYDEIDVYSRNHKLTPIQRNKIVEKYSQAGYEVNCATIARDYNVTATAIRKLLMRRGVSIKNDHSELNRQFKCNEHYFDNIDTEEKAYYFGLMYSDGHLRTNDSLVVISLQIDDIETLENFQVAIELENPVKVRESDKPLQKKDTSILYLTSRHMHKTLEEKGCIPRKSLVKKFPKDGVIPEHLLRHFIRGYFDGNGSICHYDSHDRHRIIKRAEFNITSTVSVLMGIKRVIERQVGITIGKPRAKPSNKSLLVQQISSLDRKTFLIMEWLYNKATVYMKRKYDKYLECKRLAANEQIAYRYTKRIS